MNKDLNDLNSFLSKPFNQEAFLKALGEVVVARGGYALIAKKIGVRRESLYKSLSGECNPKWGTIVKIIKALGFKLEIR